MAEARARLGGGGGARAARVVAALVLACAVLAVPPGVDGVSAQSTLLDPSICENGTVITDPTTPEKTGLVADCKILVAIRNALDPSGEVLTDWTATKKLDASQWGRTVFVGSRTIDGVARTRYLRVLDLAGRGLTGSIPSDIGGLTRLVILTITNASNITGSIPPEIGDLVALEELVIRDTGMSGSIPTKLGGLTSLKKLQLIENYRAGDTSRPGLSGPIPTQLGTLTALTRLHLYRNQLTGPIPDSLGDLTSVTSLNLRENELSGSIPTTLGSLVELTAMHLRDNGLTGAVPSEFNSLTKLVQLTLNNNSLSGAIPDLTGLPITSARNSFLWLHDNQFSGNLATTLSNLPDTMEYLNLSSNKLTGSIPATIKDIYIFSWTSATTA